jgi:hypothetical protein
MVSNSWRSIQQIPSTCQHPNLHYIFSHRIISISIVVGSINQAPSKKGFFTSFHRERSGQQQQRKCHLFWSTFRAVKGKQFIPTVMMPDRTYPVKAHGQASSGQYLFSRSRSTAPSWRCGRIYPLLFCVVWWGTDGHGCHRLPQVDAIVHIRRRDVFPFHVRHGSLARYWSMSSSA